MMTLRGLIVCSGLAVLLLADLALAGTTIPTTYDPVSTKTDAPKTTEPTTYDPVSTKTDAPVTTEPTTYDPVSTETDAPTTTPKVSTDAPTTIPNPSCCRDPQTDALRCCIAGETCCNGKCYREQCTCCNDNCYLPAGSACCKTKGACPPGGSCCQKDDSWPWCCDENSVCCPNLWGCCPKSSGCGPKVCKFALLALGKQSIPLTPAH